MCRGKCCYRKFQKQQRQEWLKPKLEATNFDTRVQKRHSCLLARVATRMVLMLQGRVSAEKKELKRSTWTPHQHLLEQVWIWIQKKCNLTLHPSCRTVWKVKLLWYFILRELPFTFCKYLIILIKTKTPEALKVYRHYWAVTHSTLTSLTFGSGCSLLESQTDIWWAV